MSVKDDGADNASVDDDSGDERLLPNTDLNTRANNTTSTHTYFIKLQCLISTIQPQNKQII